VTRYMQKLRHAAMMWAVMVLVLLAAPSATFSNASAASKTTDDERIVAIVDSLEAETQRLRIDLWEARQLAKADSLELAILTDYYTNPNRDNWLVRTIKHPIVWFALGTYFGIRAAEVH
jgi:hypothetical protein